MKRPVHAQLRQGKGKILNLLLWLPAGLSRKVNANNRLSESPRKEESPFDFSYPHRIALTPDGVVIDASPRGLAC